MPGLSQEFRTVAAFAVLAVTAASVAYSAMTGGGFCHFRARSAHAPVTEADAHAVVIEGAIDTEIVVGSKATTDADNAQIQTRTEEGVMTVRLLHPMPSNEEPHLRLTLPRLDSLVVRAGHVSVTGLSGPAVVIKSTGLAEVTASGTVDQADIAGHGKIRLNLADLQTRKMNLVLDGASDATVDATDTLEVKINGNGHVVYHGDPAHLIPKVNGVGSIEAAS